jgi:signal transduction histidine kinase
MSAEMVQSEFIQSFPSGGPVRQHFFFSTASADRPDYPAAGTSAQPVSVQPIGGLTSSGRSDPSNQTSVVPPRQPLSPLTAEIAQAQQAAHAGHERHLRQIGADLHDGPAQQLALALLHLSAVVPAQPSVDIAAAATAMRDAMTDALREIRDISVGLVLPELDRRNAAAAMRLAVDTYQRRTGCTVAFESAELPAEFNPSKALKICLYRFVQEGLQNGFKHAKGSAQSVTVRLVPSANQKHPMLVAEVCDFRPEACSASGNTNLHATWQKTLPDAWAPADGASTGLGLPGLKERIEALNGTFEVNTTVGSTKLIAQFAIATDN